jgi:hypothetical protein
MSIELIVLVIFVVVDEFFDVLPEVVAKQKQKNKKKN